MGTSITNQSLIVKKVTDETKVTLKMFKCFTARRMDGKHKSKLNIQSLLEDTIATFKPDIITVETFANEISNLNDAKSEEEMLLETKDKVKLIMKLLKKFKENPPKI